MVELGTALVDKHRRPKHTVLYNLNFALFFWVVMVGNNDDGQTNILLLCLYKCDYRLLNTSQCELSWPNYAGLFILQPLAPFLFIKWLSKTRMNGKCKKISRYIMVDVMRRFKQITQNLKCTLFDLSKFVILHSSFKQFTCPFWDEEGITYKQMLEYTIYQRIQRIKSICLYF